MLAAHQNSFQRLRYLVAICLCILGLASCARQEPPLRDDYAGDLIAAVQLADRIIIDEHSDKYDAHTPAEASSYRPRTFAQVELSPIQKEQFIAILRALPAFVQDAYPACIFNPHHTIRFYRRDKLNSTMAICFECGQVNWDGSKKDPLWSLHGGLDAFVSSIGMRTKQDWNAVAKSAGAIE